MCHSAWRQAEEDGESVDYTPFRLGVVKQCPDIIKNLMLRENESIFPGGTGFHWNETFLPGLKEQHEVLARRFEVWTSVKVKPE